MTSFRPPGDTAWNYVREHEKLSPFLKWVPRGPNLFECCVLEGWPSKVASNQPDGSYATKDLFEPHSTIPKAWKYIARLDDTIVLVNGEKFNPVHTEGTIRSNRNVAEAVIFGVGRPYLGILIVPAEPLANKSDEEVIGVLWPSIVSACSTIEAYARISKNMVKVLPYEIEYPRTDKGSVIRQAFYKAYAELINDAYDTADIGTQPLARLSVTELRGFLRQKLQDMILKESTFTDDTDFFSIGLDSLQALQLRSEILQKVDLDGHSLGQTVVFDHPAIGKLSKYLYNLGSGKSDGEDKAVEVQMNDLIERYSVPLKAVASHQASAVGRKFKLC
jgi:aryl carrier-like protein